MKKQNSKDLTFWLLAGALFVAMIWLQVSDAQDDHPAFGTHQVMNYRVEADLPAADIPKLEARAISILRKPGTLTKEAMTLAEARAYLRVNGKTDVARCMEVLIIYAVQGITQVRVVAQTVGNQHPGQDAVPSISPGEQIWEPK